MSLLHRQIAERARLNPQRGGMPWQVVTEPLSLLVSAVAGEMGSPVLQANVGAVFFATTAEAVERGRPTDTGVQSLARDILNQLVYENPEALHKRITDLNANEKKYAGSGFKPDAKYLAAKQKLIDASKTLDARAASLPPEKVAAESTYSSSFFTFKDQWDEFYDRILAGGINAGAEGELSGNEVFAKIDDFYAKYRQYYQGFIDLGYVPSIKPPEPSKSGDTFPNLPSLGQVTADVGSFLKPIILGGLVLGGLLIVPHILSGYGPGGRRGPAGAT